MSHDRTEGKNLTRRGLLAAGGAVVIGAVGGCATAVQSTASDVRMPTPTSPPTPPAPPPAPATTPNALTYPFYGVHQAGVETPPALWQTFIGIDLAHDHGRAGRDDGEALLRLVSDDAARLSQGEPALGDTEPFNALSPSGLTITVGIGRSFFDKTGTTARMPAKLVEIPAFSTDALEDRWAQTDALLQIGSNDPVALAHAVRMLTKDISTVASVTWVQPGFRAAAPATASSSSTRNLMGQVDGTINPTPGSEEFASIVWWEEPGPWQGATIMVLRRIRMLLDTWDGLDPVTKETVMGRMLESGAPLGRLNEQDPVPFGEVDSDGLPIIPTDSHIAVAHARTAQEAILRRPYNYDAGMHGGTNDMGLLFAAYMRDPRQSYIPMQERLAKSDAFNRWNTAIGSAAYVLPPGTSEGGFIGEALFT